jgi:hypothetical protein
MEGHLTYSINGIDLKMFFGNYALEKVLQHFNITVNELHTISNSRHIEFVRVYMFHAACYPILKQGGIPDFTEFDTYEWVDVSKGDILLKVNEAISKSLGLEEISEEKKNKAKS